MVNDVPGIIATYFNIALFLTIPASLILVVWYRQTVASVMRARSQGVVPSHLAAGSGDASSLHSDMQNPQELETRQSPPSVRDSCESVLAKRLVVIYGFAGAVGSAVVTASLFVTSPDLDPAPIRVFMVWYAYCWPIIPTLTVLLALRTHRAVLLFVVYVAVGAILIFGWSIFNRIVLDRPAVDPFSNVLAFVSFLAWEAWLPALIIVVTGNRRLRPVSPLVLAGLLVFSFTALVFLNAVIAAMNIAWMRQVLLTFGQDTRHLVFMLVALPVGLACWAGLSWIGRRYEEKKFSDVQLLVDSWWLIVAFAHCMFLSTSSGWGGLHGLWVFVAYRTVVAFGLALWRVKRTSLGGKRLLLLRVFGHQRRTEHLFDTVAQRWRLGGNVKMIAGADLASRTLDPGDFIKFVGGRLVQLFVQNDLDLSERLARLDEVRDPDGRFRVNEFFCHDNTWRPTLKALLLHSDLVLMDLRTFSASNSGCVFELQQLAENGLLPRTVFVIDATTDVSLLESTLSPHVHQTGLLGKGNSSAPLNLACSEARTSRDLDKIYNSLCTLVPA